MYKYLVMKVGFIIGKKCRLLLCLSVLLIVATGVFDASGAVVNKFSLPTNTGVSIEIKKQLVTERKNLHFPKSVMGFYKHNRFAPVWITGEKNPRNTWHAMLLLDCVVQYGLFHADYHPDVLLYDKLQTMVNEPQKIDDTQKAHFDVFLTDALITFMNQLHYGKLNAEFPAYKIDNGNGKFRAEDALANAFYQPDFSNAILAVQPKSKEYEALQGHMRLLKGQYLDDCYEVPEEDVRKIAINMERVRWAAINQNTYIQINIPTYTLKVYHDGTVKEFKVIVGKPSRPTSTFHSDITDVTTGKFDAAVKAKPDIEHATIPIAGFEKKGRAGKNGSSGQTLISFHIANGAVLKGIKYDKLFELKNRDLSNGDVTVDHADDLAELLLKISGAQNKVGTLHTAIKRGARLDITFPRSIPVKVTYITTEVKEGEIFNYKDIYNLDKRLEMKLYNQTAEVAVK